MPSGTYRGVDWLVALEAVALDHAVVDLAEGHAGAAVGHQAVVDGREAAAEAVLPLASILGALVVEGAAGIADGAVEVAGPVSNVIIVNWAAVVVGGRRLSVHVSHCKELDKKCSKNWGIWEKVRNNITKLKQRTRLLFRGSD